MKTNKRSLDIQQYEITAELNTMPMYADCPSGISSQSKDQQKSLHPVFLRKPVRPVIDKSVLAAFLNQTSKEEKKTIVNVQDTNDFPDKLWTRCQYCEVYLKLSNLDRHLSKCCAKLGMIIKK